VVGGCTCTVSGPRPNTEVLLVLHIFSSQTMRVSSLGTCY